MNKLAIIALLAITTAGLLFNAQNKYDPTFSKDALMKFQKWSSTHNKVYYTPEEKLYRISVFVNTYKTVTLHNMKNETYEQGLNEFSDMTYEEFVAKYTGDLSDEEFKALGQENLEISQAPVAGAIDWTTKGAVNPVQNQGQCGGCWAFAATASFETAYFNKFNQLMKFSEQASIDCDRGNNGCGGGSPDTAMAYQKASGLPSLADYPYTATTNTCKAQGKKVSMNLAFTYNFPSSMNLLTSGVNSGVTFISVYANQNFMNYKSGIFSDPNCSTSQTNHAIAAVGYDAD